MADQRLVHDAAFAMARALLDLLGDCIRPEERRDAFDGFYAVCKAGVEAYRLQADRQDQRLRPSRN